jgi:predicted nuclease of predicted toxin-antitoxin system
MRVLYDENLSPGLVLSLADVFPESAHVHDLGLEESDDLAIWQRAKAAGYCIVPKDSDYYHLSVLRGHPPKVVWLRLGNCSTQVIEDCLRRNCRALFDFLADQEESVLLLP